MSDTYTATASTMIDASAGTIWEALTDPATIEQYFFGSKVETDWEVGSPIVFRGEWDGETYEDKGRDPAVRARAGPRVHPLVAAPESRTCQRTTTRSRTN